MLGRRDVLALPLPSLAADEHKQRKIAVKTKDVFMVDFIGFLPSPHNDYPDGNLFCRHLPLFMISWALCKNNRTVLFFRIEHAVVEAQ
jgi:hypothetical protein